MEQDWTPVTFKKKKTKTVKKGLPGSKTINSNKRPNNNKNPTNYKEDEDGCVVIKKILPKNFGQKMAAARAAKGLSQKQLAQKLNCKPSEIQAYEQNKAPNPNKAFARRIERAVGGGLF